MINSCKSIKWCYFDLILIDKTNHHLFQPSLYQVAAAALSPADTAIPIRFILNNKKNTRVILEEALKIDKTNKIVKLKNSELEHKSRIKFKYIDEGIVVTIGKAWDKGI